MSHDATPQHQARIEVWCVTRLQVADTRKGKQLWCYGREEQDLESGLVLGPEVLVGQLTAPEVARHRVGGLVKLERWFNEYARLSREQLTEAMEWFRRKS